MTKTLVLYVFHIYNDRVKHFIDHCIFKDNQIDFMVISNDNQMVYVPDYVKTLIRDNIGYDFGGWSDALITNDLYKEYDTFIFVNSSVMGPFLPSSFIGKWTDIYLNGLSETIKLFGSTINSMQNPSTMAHVQSYIFSMDKTTLQYLIDCEIFSKTNYATTFKNAIHDKEILMSRKIIDNGWNIGSLFSYYNQVDFTFKDKSPDDYNIVFLDDVMYPQFRNMYWNEHELVFIKGNRVFI